MLKTFKNARYQNNVETKENHALYLITDKQTMYSFACHVLHKYYDEPGLWVEKQTNLRRIASNESNLFPSVKERHFCARIPLDPFGHLLKAFYRARNLAFHPALVSPALSFITLRFIEKV